MHLWSWIILCALIGTGAAGADEPQDKPPLYQPPSSGELSRGRREVLRELESIAKADIEIPTVPEGKPANFFQCVAQYEAAGKDRRKLAYVIGQQLGVAWKLLATNPDQDKDQSVRRSGLGIARFAAEACARRLKQPKLAVQACEVYLLPHLDVCDKRPTKLLASHHVLKTVLGIQLQAKNYEGTERTARMLLEAAPNSNVADFARLKLAEALHRQQRTREAIAVLEQIDTSQNAGMAGSARFIPELKAELDKTENTGRERPAEK